MKKVLVLTDMDTVGSGYRSVCGPLFTELAKMEYEIKIVGLSNRGEEHPYPFSILPATNLQEATAIAGNMIQLWQPDVLVVAMDLPVQAQVHAVLAQYGKPYIAITPLENGPLCMTWAAPLYNMQGVFFISELGKQEALKVGVQAEHLQVGVDTVSWRPAFPEEKKKLREGLGISQDAFVVLTVADNQERKNLAAGLESISLLKKEIERPIRYIIVTREQSPFGWRLRDLAIEFGINQEYTPFERGMPQQDLWALYAVADIYLQPSKAEGLGLPVLDAMCCKVPIIATDTGAMTELLSDGRGFLVPGYPMGKKDHFRDVWGNSKRVMIDIEKLAGILAGMGRTWHPVTDWNCVETAYEYIKARTWDIPANQLHKKITEILDGKKTENQAS